MPTKKGSTFTKQLAACDMQHMCIDCAAAKQAHGCAEAETGAGEAAVAPSVFVRAASEVVLAGPDAPELPLHLLPWTYGLFEIQSLMFEVAASGATAYPLCSLIRRIKRSSARHRVAGCSWLTRRGM